MQVIFQSRATVFVQSRVSRSVLDHNNGRTHGLAKYLAPLMDLLNFVDNGHWPAVLIALDGFSAVGETITGGQRAARRCSQRPATGES